MHARTLALVLACFLPLAGCDDNPAQPSCTYALSATSMTVGPAGGTWSLGVSTGNTCSWTASSGVSWVALTGGASGTGPGAATITVTRNEILYSLNKPDDFILAIVEFCADGSHRLHYVREPFRREPDFGVTSVNYDFSELLSRAVAPV